MVEILIEGVEGLEEFGGTALVFVIQKRFFGVEHIPEDLGGEVFFEEYAEDAGALAWEDLAGIGLVVVEDEELTRTDGYPAIFDAVPFFASENRLNRKAADVVGAIALGAEGVEDNILFFEPAVMGLFVETGGVMDGQLREIHSWKN